MSLGRTPALLAVLVSAALSALGCARSSPVDPRPLPSSSAAATLAATLSTGSSATTSMASTRRLSTSSASTFTSITTIATGSASTSAVSTATSSSGVAMGANLSGVTSSTGSSSSSTGSSSSSSGSGSSSGGSSSSAGLTSSSTAGSSSSRATRSSGGRSSSSNSSSQSSSSGSSTGPTCAPAGGNTELEPCTSVTQCLCPLICNRDAFTGAGTCEYPCVELSDCPNLATVCDGTACIVNQCGQGTGNGQFNSTCNVVGTNDGTCVPDQLPGGVEKGVCVQGGQATGACNYDADRHDISQACVAGMECVGGGLGGGGVCGDACDPFGSGPPCPDGQLCSITVNDMFAGACYNPNG